MECNNLFLHSLDAMRQRRQCFRGDGLVSGEPLKKSGVERSLADAVTLNSVDDEKCAVLPQEAIDVLSSFSDEQIWWPSGSSRKFETPGALDLFTGRGGVARALLRSGAPFVVTFEWKRPATDELLKESNRSRILRLIELRAQAGRNCSDLLEFQRCYHSSHTECQISSRGIIGSCIYESEDQRWQ